MNYFRNFPFNIFGPQLTETMESKTMDKGVTTVNISEILNKTKILMTKDAYYF